MQLCQINMGFPAEISQPQLHQKDLPFLSTLKSNSLDDLLDRFCPDLMIDHMFVTLILRPMLQHS